MENKKKEREDANNTTTRKMDSKFAASEVKAQGTQLKYGLVTLDEMMAAENNAEAEKKQKNLWKNGWKRFGWPTWQ